MSAIKVNIFSPGRFHVCALARELDKQGFDVKFYSFVSARRAEKFGLPRRCSASVLWFVWPFLLLERKIFKGKKWSRHLRILVQDWITSVVMRKADVVISMTGCFVIAPQKAKVDGSIIVYERGSKHILEQKRILDEIKRKKGIEEPFDEFNVKRELSSYEQADYISIPSKHAMDSFIMHNYPIDKLFVNPYGVELNSFYSMPDVPKIYDVIMVGGWSLQKGCDLIVDAIRMSKLKFLHVGAIVDVEFPKDDNLKHIPPVDEKDLVNYYAQAKVFVLPSRQDGFGMVLSQALACGLPIVGSPNTGAVDLRKMVESPEYIEIMESYSSESIIKSINKLLTLREQKPIQSYAGDAIKNLTWEAYGKRYADFLNSIVK